MSNLKSSMVSVSLHGQTVEIPDPLTLSSGEKVASTQQWKEQRRPEILELFRSEVYGRTPVERPQNLKFEVTELQTDAMDGAATRKRIRIAFAGPGSEGAFNVLLYVPNKRVAPAPCFLLINNRGGSKFPDPALTTQSEFWPAEEIVKRGYAAAIFSVWEVDPDEHDDFKNGVHGVFDGPEPRSADAWGTIAAWAWAASRVMDYFETDPQIDAERVGVVGHSRGGKTALWAGAQDERFALVVSNNSGNTGAALSRGKQGESVARINTKFPHWFNANYKKYGDKENELPVDQHQLLALIAPRLLYIASATEDTWADPQAEWMSGIAASPVYELFGLQGLSAATPPAPEIPLVGGHIGYHLRSGKHALTLPDWSRFMDFADRHFPAVKCAKRK